jgi:hypothetical protein
MAIFPGKLIVVARSLSSAQPCFCPEFLKFFRLSRLKPEGVKTSL